MEGDSKGEREAITRCVAGRSATSRSEKGNLDSKRIWIPVREFLGSTPWDDPSASYPSTDWRKPEINPWYPEDPSGKEMSPQEVGLRGTVDKDDSIVNVYPRMPVYRVCRTGADYEGCMKVGENGGITCACDDRYDSADCSCETLLSPMYFQCDGGEFEGMPCTRHKHCDSKSGKSGNCSQKPSCQPKGPNRIWRRPWNGTPVRLPQGIGECWNDDDCQKPHTCGYRLFDLSDRTEQPNPTPPPSTRLLIELDREILPGGRVRRGVCEVPPCDVKCNGNQPCPRARASAAASGSEPRERRCPDRSAPGPVTEPTPFHVTRIRVGSVLRPIRWR